MTDYRISKQQLAELAEHYGDLDEGSGRILRTFAGSLSIADGLYHGQLIFEDPPPDVELPKFFISSIIPVAEE